MDKTQLVQCKCTNEYQDKTYGKGMRVTTPKNSEQAKKHFVVRCTVCGAEHSLGMLK
jgi:hypothetical protein